MNFFGAVSVYAAYWVVTLMICLHIPYMFLPYNFSMFPPIDGGRIYKVGQFCDPILYVRSDFHCHVVWVWKLLSLLIVCAGSEGRTWRCSSCECFLHLNLLNWQFSIQKRSRMKLMCLMISLQVTGIRGRPGPMVSIFFSFFTGRIYQKEHC